MSLFKSLKALRDECGISTVFPITHLNSSSVFESKNAVVGSTLKLLGVPFVTQEPSQLNYFKYLWHRTVLNLDEHYGCYVTVHRTKQNIHLDGNYQQPFAQQLNDKYHAQFTNHNLYQNDIYVTLIYKGLTSGKAGKGLQLLKRLSDKSMKQARDCRRTEQLKKLNSKVAQWLTSLAPFKPHLLGSHDEQLGYSELLSFLSLVVNGGDCLPFKAMAHAPRIGKSIHEISKGSHHLPKSHLGQYLCHQQLLFGDAIQFQGATPATQRFGQLLSIKQYGTTSCSLMLDPLLHLDSEFILTHSFFPEENSVALQRIQLQRAKLSSAQDKAATQIDALVEVEDFLASGMTTLGYHHHTLMLLKKTKDELAQTINQAVKAYAACGIVVVKETLGQEAAFWAQIPCNQHLIARASLITSENFTDFHALHNYQSGSRDLNHLGSAVTLLETPSRTPVFFNYHVPGSKHNPSKGHALIIGGNNCGKTTFATFVDAQMGRYHGRTFYLDRDRGAEIYIRACGGVYLTISPSRAHELQQNPLQLPDTAENRQFLKEWLHHLVKKEGELEVPSEIAERLSECIDYAYEQLQEKFRTLSHITKILPVDFDRWPELRRWLRGSGKHFDGDHAWLFDNEKEALNLNTHKVGFDITYLMDSVSEAIATPVYMYLLHRIRLCLDGQLTSILIDEGWQVLLDPYWLKYLQKWLPTIRKKNAHLVLMTQSPETIAKSPIAAELLDNNATLILFANPMANPAIYKEILKLTPAEFETIQINTPESRLFLYKQEKTAILCRLDLSALTDELQVLSGNEKAVRRLDRIRAQVGDLPANWLPLFYEQGSL